MISYAMFRVTEYEGPHLGKTEIIIAFYQSRPMCLRDASRFAAALSYARGEYVEVEPASIGENYREWWYAGSIWREARVPPIRIRQRFRSYVKNRPRIETKSSQLLLHWVEDLQTYYNGVSIQ